MRFADPAFEKRLHKAALEYCAKMRDGEKWPFCFRPDDEGGWLVDPEEAEEEVTATYDAYFPPLWSHSGGAEDITLEEFVEIIEHASQARPLDDTALRSGGKTLVHVDPQNAAAHYYEEGAHQTPHEVSATTVVAGHQLEVRFLQGLSFFHLYRYWQPAEHFHDYLPPFDERDLFVEILHTPETPDDVVLQALWAFLFEVVAVTQGAWVPWKFLNREEPEDYHLELDASVLDIADGTVPLQVFPPVAGPGLTELQQHFVKAENDYIPLEYRFLEYVKILEYVSATVVRQELHDLLLRKLRLPEVLRPDAAYLDGIARVVDEQRRGYRKDADAIRLVLQRCTDSGALSALIPDVLRNRRKSGGAVDLISEFAASVTDTRNQIAHAKANYQSTGREVPAGELTTVLPALRAAAVQVFRWFAALPAHLRVLG